jgi:hypothetical protein
MNSEPEDERMTGPPSTRPGLACYPTPADHHWPATHTVSTAMLANSTPPVRDRRALVRMRPWLWGWPLGSSCRGGVDDGRLDQAQRWGRGDPFISSTQGGATGQG